MNNPLRNRMGTPVIFTIVIIVAIAGLADAFQGRSGYSSEPMWVYDSDLMVGHVETADLNGDGVKDVIAGENNPDYYGYPSRVIALDGATGDTIWTYLVQDAIRSMTIGDLNDDGVMDVVAGASYNGSNTPDGYVHAIDGVTGARLWRFYIGNTVSCVTVADLNGDAYLDVAAGSFDDNIYGINGQTGGQLWMHPVGALWINAVSAGDVNGDNIDDIGFAHEYLAGYDNYFGVLDGTDGSPIWQMTVPYVVMNVLMADIDSDGEIEAIFGGTYNDNHGEIFVRNGLDGALEWGYNLGTVDHVNGNILLYAGYVDEDADIDLLVAPYLGSRQIYAFDGTSDATMWISDVLASHPTDITVGDVTGDKNMNVITAGGDRVEVVDGIDGSYLWYYSVGGSMRSVSCADLNADDIDEIAAGGGADQSGTPPNPLKSVWALKTVVSPVIWEHSLGEYGNEIALGDFNGDQCQDVVAVTSIADAAVAVNGVDGSLIGSWQSTANLYTVTTGDFNNDGFDDAAVAGADETVTAFDFHGNAVLWQFPDPTDQIYRKCLMSTDLNDDGYDDVIAGARDNMVYALRGESGGVLWSTDVGGAVTEVDLAQVDGTGPLDVVVATRSGPSGPRALVLDGLHGSIIWEYTAPDAIEHVEAMDVNEDGVMDFAIGVTPYAPRQVIMVDGATRTQIWSQPLLIPSNIERMGGGDVDADKIPDVIVPTDGGVYALRGSDGFVLWDFPTGSEVNHTMVYDVDGDGFNEVIAGSDDQNVYVIDGLDGSLKWNYSTAGDVMHIQIGDVDCNNKANIVCVTFDSDGSVYAFRTLDQTPDAVCGDADGDDATNIGDAVYLINYIFKSGPAPDPLCSADANGDDGLNIADAVYLITYIFKSGPPPVDNCCVPAW